jgi:hypothetical protein
MNDISYQKIVDVLQSLPKKPLCKYQGKMKNENAYSTYRRKNMKEKKI